MKFKTPTPLNIFKSIDEDRYTKHEPTLMKINSSLFENGILNKELYSYFENDFSDLSFFIQTLRDSYVKDFGFFLVTEDFLDVSKNFLSNKHVLEVGAGTGFLSNCLHNNGINITSIDLETTNNKYGFQKMHHNIIEGDAVKYLKKNLKSYSTVLMSWPNYSNDFAYNILKVMEPNQSLIYIGESFGGCTANDKFFNLLEKKAKINVTATENYQANHVSWPCIHDKVYVYDITN